MSDHVDPEHPRLELLTQALTQIREQLNQPHFEPDASRGDWANHITELESLEHAVEGQLIGQFESLRRDPEYADIRGKLAGAAADLLTDAAGLAFAAGRERTARSWMRTAIAWTAGSDNGRVYGAGVDNLASFTAFVRVWWLHHHEQLGRARALAKVSAKSAPPAIEGRLRDYLEAPQPLTSAPGGYSINGIGTRFYGQADQREDGIFRITRYFTLVYVPLVPIDSFWVRPEDDGWRFFAKAKLSGGQVWWRRAIFALAGVGLASSLVLNHLDSLSYRVGELVDEAHTIAVDDATALEAALARYEQFFADHAHDDTKALAPALEHYVELLGHGVESPFRRGQVPVAKRAAQRFSALPDRVRWSSGGHALLRQFQQWSDDCAKSGEEADLIAALNLMEDALRVTDGEDQTKFTRVRDGLRIRLGDSLAEAWPLDAMAYYAQSLNDRRGMDQATKHLQALREQYAAAVGPWLEMRTSIEAWAKRAAVPEPMKELVARDLRLSEDAERATLLNKGDANALAKAFEASPRDQPLGLALATRRASLGDVEGALATIKQLGPPGFLNLDVRLFLAQIHSERGQFAEADQLLSRSLNARLPSFEAARTRYADATSAFRDRYLKAAQTGTLPADVMQDLHDKGQGPDGERAQAEAFGEHLSRAISQDRDLQALEAEYVAQSAVVPLAIQLASLRLRQAKTSSGAERQRLLDSAEQTFLSIQGEAQGAPAFHLGLGRVYHRLGKPDKGDAEFAQLLGRNEPAFEIAVARAYRELGIRAKALAISEKAYEQSQGEIKHVAARLRAAIAIDPRDKRTWLERCDQKFDVAVKYELINVEADLDVEAGRLRAAAKKYERVAEHYLKNSASESSAANNGSLALLDAYHCTGEPKTLARSLEAMATASRLAPENALVLGNYASVLEHAITLDTLSDHLQVRELRLRASESAALLSQLSNGELQDQLQTRYRQHADFKRLTSLLDQWETLAPGASAVYSGQFALYAALRDETALSRLAGRLKSVEHIDTSQRVDMYNQYLSGENDGEAKNRTANALELGRERVARLRKRKHRPTLAVALEMVAEAHLSMVDYEPEIEHTEAAVKALEEARKLWPAGNFDRILARALELSAVVSLLDAQPGLQALWGKYRRVLGDSFLQAVVENGDPSLRAQLKASSALARAARLRHASPSPERSVHDVCIAKLVGHKKLLETASNYAREAGALTRAEMAVRLRPYDESLQRQLDWVKSAQ